MKGIHDTTKVACVTCCNQDSHDYENESLCFSGMRVGKFDD